MGGCSCDGDIPSVYNKVDRTARKKYQCVECRTMINPGDRYRYLFGVWNGDAKVYRTCERCADLQDNLTAIDWCIEHGELKENYQQYLDYSGSNKSAWDILKPITEERG